MLRKASLLVLFTVPSHISVVHYTAISHNLIIHYDTVPTVALPFPVSGLRLCVARLAFTQSNCCVGIIDFHADYL